MSFFSGLFVFLSVFMLQSHVILHTLRELEDGLLGVDT